MKVKEFIEKLSRFPQDANVVLCDSNRMAYEASGEPSSEGLYYNFEADFDNEMFFEHDDEDQENPVPTVVISFETDYEEKAKEIRDMEQELKNILDKENQFKP